MTALGFALAGATSGNPVEADANGNLQVVLPTTASQAGYAKLVSNSGTGNYNEAEIGEEGRLTITPTYSVWNIGFNTASTTQYDKLFWQLTTLARAISNGYMRLNSGSVTTASSGISCISKQCVNIDEGTSIRVRMYAKTTNATATNKTAELGLSGLYAAAAGQAGVLNEFIGFRWTNTGGLLGVLETSAWAATPTTQTVTINGGTPFSDGVTREYEMRITERKVDFYVEGIFYGTISRPSASWSGTARPGLNWTARVYHGASAASAAFMLDLGVQDVQRYSIDYPGAAIQAGMSGRTSYFAQTDLSNSAVPTHNFPASGTAPTAATGSNTASVLNNTALMGGFYQMNAASITATANSNVIVAGFQNNGLSSAAGASQTSRTFWVTGISISPAIVITALSGGTGSNLSWLWFAAVGSTALSLATTDADGGAAYGTKAPRLVPLPLLQTIAIAGAAGTVTTDVGDHSFTFPTPIPVYSGEFLHLGIRSVLVGTAAATAGTLEGSVSVNGFWM